MGLINDKIAPGKFLEMTLLATDYFEAGYNHIEFSLHPGQTII
jgi:hypothetical protein